MNLNLRTKGKVGDGFSSPFSMRSTRGEAKGKAGGEGQACP